MEATRRMTTPPAPPVQAWASLTVATANVLNLALPNRQFYDNQDPYTEAEYQRKLDWLGDALGRLQADVIAVQEVWDEAALKAAVSRSGAKHVKVIVPGAENDEHGKGGAQGTPCVGLVTRLAGEDIKSFTELPPGHSVLIPELGEKTRFERAPLLARLRTREGRALYVLNLHMKSKRPKFLQDEHGKPTEDRQDPRAQARATLRSLMIRATEAAAVRSIVCDVLSRTHEPLIVMGDFNDSPHSVTTQMVAATQEVAYDKAARDVALFNAYEVQGMPLKRDVAFSHIHQGSPETLDQILVSEEFLPHSRHSIGDVRRVDYFNDHLHEGKDRSRSDHGFVRAVLRLKLEPKTESNAELLK